MPPAPRPLLFALPPAPTKLRCMVVLPPAPSSLLPAKLLFRNLLPMPEIDKHEIRSPELQEVMSGIPGSFLKWGLFLFFAIILAILGVTWFINYPNIVTAPVTITTYNSPASLIAKSGGKIEKLIVSNGDDVILKQPVALIENTARFEDVQVT